MVSNSNGRRKQFLVMFTGYDSPLDKKLVTELGGKITENLKECTVLVTDKIRRTAKFLCMVAKGVPIVDPGWLEASKATKSFQGQLFNKWEDGVPLALSHSACTLPDPWTHLIRDEESEKKWGFNLSTTLRAASKSLLLAGFKVHATKSVVPPPDQLKGTAARRYIPLGCNDYNDILPLFFRHCRVRRRPVAQGDAQSCQGGRLRHLVSRGQEAALGGLQEQGLPAGQGDSLRRDSQERARLQGAPVGSSVKEYKFYFLMSICVLLVNVSRTSLLRVE